MKESIKIPSEFLFLYYHFDEIKRFFEGGMLEEFTDLRYLTPHEFRTNYVYHDHAVLTVSGWVEEKKLMAKQNMNLYTLKKREKNIS